MTNLWGEPSQGRHGQPDPPSYGRHTAWREGAVSVATLLAEAQRDGRPLWLDWPDEGAPAEQRGAAPSWPAEPPP
jgi:hypothetical protein